MVPVELGILNQWYRIVLNNLGNICDFDLFKMTIQRWKLVDCPCRLGKGCPDGLGFITVLS